MLFTRDGVWETSWSRLQKFMECRQKAKLYGEKKGIADKPSRNFLPGRTIDLVCRNWLANPQGTMVSMAQSALDECIGEIKESDDEYLRWRDKSDREKVTQFIENALINLEPILKAKVIPFEYEQAVWFRTKIRITGVNGETAEINLIGEKDIVVHSPEVDGIPPGQFVYDLKGTGNKDYWKKCIGQMVFYDLETLASTGKPTLGTAIIQPAVEPNYVPIPVSNEMRTKILSDIVAMYHATQTNNFPVSPVYTPCSMCECKNACPKFKLSNLVVRNPFDGS